MQLKIQRTQRTGGVMGNTAVFCLDVRMDYSVSEAANIAKYRLGREVIYNSRAAKRYLDRFKAGTRDGGLWGYVKGAASLAMAKLSLNISIDSLGRGQHIECKDMLELLEAEEEVMEACRTLKRFLETAATFNGSIALIDFDDGEKLHTGSGSLELLSAPTESLVAALPLPQHSSDEHVPLLDRFTMLEPEQRQRILFIAAGVVILLVILVKCA
jgi:hypothetical protein